MKKGIVFLSALFLGAIGINVSSREPLTFQERVKAQEAIERVYYNHRIWPKENPEPKPPFEKMVSKEVIEAKVTDYLKKCVALDQFWQRPIIASQLQAEMDRMAKGSKDPATLNELFSALDNDPYLIAECLARPVLADRLIHNWYANDTRFHQKAKEQAEEALKTLTPENFCGYPEGQYSKMAYKMEIEGREELEEMAPHDESIKLDEKEFAKMQADIPEEGKVSEIQEKNDFFVITHTIEKNEAEIEVESLVFHKQSADAWLKDQNLKAELPAMRSETKSLYLPQMPESTCTEGWDNGIFDDYPDPTVYHTAVWTGTEMIVWGGANGQGSNKTGAKYNPSTDVWTRTSTGTNCPIARYFHTAVWTGTKMIVWGGDGRNTGGEYDPSSDTWTATSTGTNCPSGRSSHTAVWTGTEMIIWGGKGSSPTYKSDGGKYDPLSDTWTTVSTGTNCPSPRYNHTAVWTSTEMIVWGGDVSSSPFYTNTGGRYNPSTDTWLTTSTGPDCPSMRDQHTAVWADSKMIVWGGYNGTNGYMNTGGVFNPSTDGWTPTSTGTNVPVPRNSHVAFWTGTEMIIWGGNEQVVGGRYNPSSNAWVLTSTVNAPSGRKWFAGVWTDNEMIVWGGFENGYLNTGGRYNPGTDSWLPTPKGIEIKSQAIWTGTEMVLWAGLNNIARYSPAIDSWNTSASTNGPVGRSGYSSIWTGTDMIIWGGNNGSYLNTGGRYNPLSNNWTATSTGTDVPSARRYHSAVWTDTEMIVWGGSDGSYLNTGGRYNPSTDTWTPTSTGTNVPSARSTQAVWTGTEMIVWGGSPTSRSGGKYNPSTDTWLPMSEEANCPPALYSHSAVWTGNEMIIWGENGYGGMDPNMGGRYYPSTDSWLGMASFGVKGRIGYSTVWTGSKMIVWGGYDDYDTINSGGLYAPSTDSWTWTIAGNAPLARYGHSAVWTGAEMIIWGGANLAGTVSFNSGGMYVIPTAPLGLQNNSADDSGGCGDEGVTVNWTPPSNWGNGPGGTRTFDILRDGTPIATGLSESTLSYTDTTGDNGVTYLYQVRANNGCGLSTTTTGVSAADNIGTSPDEVANYNDVYSWDSVSGADGYRVYRGILSDLPNLKTTTADGCLRYEGTATSFDCSGDDPSTATGHLYWYLVTAYTGACEGTAGEGTEFTRNLSSSGVCP